MVLTFFLATLGFGSFEVTLSLLEQGRAGAEGRPQFPVFAYVGFVLMLAQGFLYRRLANRVSEPTFMAIGIVLHGAGRGAAWAASTAWPNAGDAGLPDLLLGLHAGRA